MRPTIWAFGRQSKFSSDAKSEIPVADESSVVCAESQWYVPPTPPLFHQPWPKPPTLEQSAAAALEPGRSRTTWQLPYGTWNLGLTPNGSFEKAPVKTSSPRLSSPPRASAQDGHKDSRSSVPSSPRSPAVSSTSTADGDASPVIPPLQAPRLPERVQDFLRTPPRNEGRGEEPTYVTTSWGSPYPQSDRLHRRRDSLSSGPSSSDYSPAHHRLELTTPFLRPAPRPNGLDEEQPPASLVSAAVLANRARRPTRGLTEDWIRQHTSGGEGSVEARNWLSDGTGDSENSSLSGSLSGDEAAWLEESDPKTPRGPTVFQRTLPRTSSKTTRYPRTRSSNETLKQADVQRISNLRSMSMASPDLTSAFPEGASQAAFERPLPEPPSTPKRSGNVTKTDSPRVGFNLPQLPQTPTRSPGKQPLPGTPRLKKKVPWKGKNIMILLPRDDDRGEKDHAPMPISESDVTRMLQSWAELGYSTRGFDLGDEGLVAETAGHSQSRLEWPSWEDVMRERHSQPIKVTLPDLNSWKRYVEELQEAKLRALGVTLSGDEPSPAISPAPISRQASVTHYPPLPFSPPIPTSSAASNPQFPFPAAFTSSATQSPALVSASPVSFNGKFNPRQSISIPAGGFQMPQQLPSPHGFSPQAVLLHHGHARGGSPSLANLSSMMSPTSPFSPEGFQHHRNQSLQYPMLPHQQFQPARASPRLHDLREVDEEAESKSPSKTPEPSTAMRHNASASLQKEIDEAEYHLEEQFRSQLEHDKDYSPHDEKEDDNFSGVAADGVDGSHEMDDSAQFAPHVERFREDSEEARIIHQPKPHTRGHSLSQKYFTEQDGHRAQASAAESSLKTLHDEHEQDHGQDESYEIQTNPSNLGTPIEPAMDFSKVLQQHQHSFSTVSNPWSDGSSKKPLPAQRFSHGSKASVSGLNVEAPEFKFNPTSTFQPGLFDFGSSGNALQPTTAFNAGTGANSSLPKVPLSAQSSQFSFGSSKINANAPVFSPGQSEFNFSASGPKFRPDAPSFMPMHSMSNSLTSPPLSGSESIGNRGSSIFGHIDLSASDMIKPAKKSKAIPIVRPTSRPKSEDDEPQYDQEGRIIDETRVKRAKAAADDGDDVPLFAEPTVPTPVTEPPMPEELQQMDNLHVDVKSGDEQGGDTTFSSTMVSESTDAKTATSPSEISPQQSTMNWAPFEFKSQISMQAFDSARPFEDTFRTHKKSLSAAAKPFIPLGMSFRESNEDESDAEEPAGEAAEEAEEAERVEELEDGEVEEVDVDDRDAEGETVDVTMEEETVEMEEPAPESALPTLSSLNLTESVVASTPPPPPVKKGLAASRFASSPSSPPRPQLSATTASVEASRYVVSPPTDVGEGALGERRPQHSDFSENEQPMLVSPQEAEDMQIPVPEEESLPAGIAAEASLPHEPTVEEIDDILHHMEHHDPTNGVNKTAAAPQWHHPSPQRHISLAAVTTGTPLYFAPRDQQIFRSHAPSPSPVHHRLHQLEDAHRPIPSMELEDPFVDPPQEEDQEEDQFSESNIHHLRGSETAPDSVWDGAFSDDEQAKLEARANFFDSRVNELVGTVLAARLRPLEKVLDHIQQAVAAGSSRRPTSSRIDARSTSAEIQHSDADDEDDEVPRRSMSPRRDRRLEQIRAAVLEAMAIQQRNAPPPPPPAPVVEAPVAPTIVPSSAEDMASIMKAMDDMKEQFEKSLHLDFRGEDLRNIVEDAVERRMVPTPQPVVVDGQNDLSDKFNELQVKYAELEQRFRLEQVKVESEVSDRRAAEERTAELDRKLQMAETKIEVEIMNRSVFDQRVNDLEDRLKQQEERADAEILGRRNAEDRLSENQRLLRISSEEETRLRETVEEMEQKVKAAEETRGKTTMRLALLEAAQANNQKSHIDFQNRINATETELREARQEVRNWKAEAERVNSIARHQGSDLSTLNDENKHLKKLIDTLGTQLEENERIRESWHAKFVSLQSELTNAAGLLTEENARNIKKEQELLARQDVLDAKLQAEARTRERLESELERLENGERQGLRAVNECKRLEALLSELRTENHQLQQSSARYQAEFQEARESGAREVQRTRDAMQSEVEAANHRVNLVREEMEDQAQRLRAQIDQVRLDADIVQAKHEMLLEESQTNSKTELAEQAVKQQAEIQDLRERYERQLNNATEDAQRNEQNLLERLDISTSKAEHLQDRVDHLEEKLEIAKEAAAAALAAAKAAKAAAPEAGAGLQSPVAIKSAPRTHALPEKISPQALRESIMVLQEQLQEREQRLEELEQTLAKVDPDAETKISKRDDEILWLRELLAVRHSDLQDIIAALEGSEDGEEGGYDPIAVRDAAIRLKANLQMEEQERERAVNGGSAINLPNIAATIRDAATPRVAQAVQAVGPLAAAWGNWRNKSRDQSGNGATAGGAFSSISGVLSSPATRASNGRAGGNGNGSSSTPAKSSPAASSNSFLGGLLTPPASGLRPSANSTPQQQQQHQPTAFGNTGRRLTAQQLANSRARNASSSSSASASMRHQPLQLQQQQQQQTDKTHQVAAFTPQRRSSRGMPVTPPMMRNSSYDSDAHAEEFDDAGFFDDE